MKRAEYHVLNTMNQTVNQDETIMYIVAEEIL